MRGKKNLVIQKDLLGPLGLFVKFSTLQEYGVEKLFVLENHHVETNQRNIVFVARGEKPKQVQAIAGGQPRSSFSASLPFLFLSSNGIHLAQARLGS